MVSKGNHPQMAQQFRVVNYYNLPIYIYNHLNSSQLMAAPKLFIVIPIPHRIHVWYIYANIWGILMVNVTIYRIHGSYGFITSTAPQKNL